MIRTVADQILDYLEREGATTLFCVPGAGNAQLLHAVRKRHPTFTLVICRHETGAAYMADGFFRATDRPGVVIVTSGPGATNALTGALNAQFGGSAVLVLTGEVAERFLGRGYLQDGTDTGLNVRDVFAAATRFSADVTDASSAPILLEQALRDMMSIPRRAVRLGLPDSVAGEIVPDVTAKRPRGAWMTYRAVPEGAPGAAVRCILERFAEARRPLLMLGDGCRVALRNPETAHALHRLVERWQIPVITTSNGKGVFPEDHPLSLGAYGFGGCQWPQYWMLDGDKRAAHDLLVVVGSSLGELATNRWNPMLMPGGDFVQVDMDQSVIGRGFPITHGFVAEAGALFHAMWDQAPAYKRDAHAVEQRRRAICSLRSSHSAHIEPDAYASETAPMHPAALCRVMNARLTDQHALIFIDSGNCVGWAMHYLNILACHELHASLAMAPMGFAVAAVVGAGLARRDRLAIALVGDGAFLMHSGEVSTAAAHRVGAIWIVLEDRDLRMVTQGMEMLFGESFTGEYALGTPDLCKIAEGLGADAHLVEWPSELDARWDMVCSRARAGRPQVVVARIDTAAQPPYYAKPYWQPEVE